MNNTNKVKTILAIAVIVLMIAGVFLVATGILERFQPHSSGKLIAPNTWLFVFNERSATNDIINHNTISNIGEQWHRNSFLYNVSSPDALKYFSSGNATVSTSLTKLTTEATTNGFTRKVADTIQSYNTGGDYGINDTVTFTCITNPININAFALHWQSTSNSDNNAFAFGQITAQTFAVGSKAIVSWLITCDDN